MCGAVSGAIMAINVFLGRNLPAEPVDKSYMAVKKLINMFEGKFGSTNCKQLTGCDLGTEEGQRTFKLNNIIEKCRNYVEEATRIAMSIIEEKS